ncbi:hypothetical protein VTL71DRAFT_13450 [Oculimacula yallundae]|uniref:Uncharacterized protein n=1 Tax=Oculimacula yallundae TaxID=86028 RepID=A0ABR4CKZ0_9HELO
MTSGNDKSNDDFSDSPESTNSEDKKQD